MFRVDKANSPNQNQCSKKQLELPKQKKTIAVENMNKLQSKFGNGVLIIEIKASSEDDFFGFIHGDLVVRRETRG